jgi:hypothetical protein
MRKENLSQQWTTASLSWISFLHRSSNLFFMIFLSLDRYFPKKLTHPIEFPFFARWVQFYGLEHVAHYAAKDSHNIRNPSLRLA